MPARTPSSPNLAAATRAATLDAGRPRLTHLAVEGVSHAFQDRRILSDITFSAAPGDRLGLIGENGTGKSTLLRVIAGDLIPDRGSVALPGSVGLLAQEHPYPDDTPLAGVLDDAQRSAVDALVRLEDLGAKLAAHPEDPAAASAYADALEAAERSDAWSSEARKASTDAEVPYIVEDIKAPENVDAQVGALDFFPDGRLIAGFLRGEIMIYNPKTEEWKMFAEGLHEPLGIEIISDSEILVMQRPELTRLKDTNGDGYADSYETVTDDFGITGNYHEFNYGPIIDPDGNIFIGLNSASSGGANLKHVRGTLDTITMGQKGQMYSSVPYRGWIMKLDKSGELQPYANGFRSPNGMGFDANHNLFVTENQGDWVGTSALYHVQVGNFYGHPSSLVWKTSWKGDNPLLRPVEELDQMRTKAAVLFPHGIMANSPTQPLLDDTNGDFGPFTGQLLVGEMNSGRIVRVMLEEVGGAIQGACVYFLNGDSLRKGNNRLAFAPDGSLWVGQAEYGWAGARGIQRISYTGKMPMDIQTMNLTPTGFDLTFTQTIKRETAEDLANYKVRRYRYEYHKKYGSPQIDLRDIDVTEVLLSEDGKVSLKLAELDPGYIYELSLDNIQSTSGDSLTNDLICYTANNLVSSPSRNTQ